MTRQPIGALAARKKPMLDRFCARSVIVAGVIGALAVDAHATEALDEVAATKEICSVGPSVALARAQRLRGDAEVTAAAILPLPSLVLEHQRSFTGETERETVVGVSVAVSLGGRRGLLRQAAIFRQQQARADSQGTLFEAALAFREAIVAANVAQARVRVLEEQQAAMESLSTTIEGLARGGESAGYDLLRQQLQARVHRSALAAARARATAARSVVEVWLQREVTLPGLELPSPMAAEPQRATRQQRDTAPMSSQKAAAEASALEAQAARRRWVPNVEVFAGYRQITAGAATGHGVSLALTVPLTFFERGQGEAARAEAERGVADALVASLQRDQLVQLNSLRLHIQGLLVALDEAKEAGSAAMDVQERARRLYTAGEASITELLETFRGTEEVRITRIELTEEVLRTRLALMRAAGSMWDPALDRACQDPESRAR